MQLPGGLGPLHVVECGEEASVCFSCAWLTELILIRNGSLVRTHCFEDAGVSVNGGSSGQCRCWGEVGKGKGEWEDIDDLQLGKEPD